MSLVSNKKQNKKWEFWIDRGGTFTDVVAKSPQGELLTKKYLSENPEAYDDAALHGIRRFLGVANDEPIPLDQVETVKMGTTVATNALLEKKGEPTVLATTKGFRDVIEIGYQARPETFALNIQKPQLVYGDVIEIDERILENGTIAKTLDADAAYTAFKHAYDKGYRSIAIVLMHAYKYTAHEQTLVQIAKKVGFTQISASHDVSPLTKIVSRGETTIVDAYLTPILRRYVDRIADAVDQEQAPGQLLFMQSSGGLIDASKFRGRDAILSGPAGGIVGSVHTARLAGFDKVIGFDMGGTSTDVSHYAGEFEKVYETQVAGVRMRVPMMYIHTVAAGGGSLLKFEDSRFRVGPDSAGANPGPVCYRRGGLLAVTDINVCLGKLQPEFFPKIFGPGQNLPLDRDAACAAFAQIAQQVGGDRSAEDVAEGFLEIAVEHMAQAIKKISVSRGYDVKDYVMNCFGGAGGQHACLVAERLGLKKILLHPFSGVLSAYGMGLASIQTERQRVVDRELSAELVCEIDGVIKQLMAQNEDNLAEQGVAQDQMHHTSSALMRYKGADTTIQTPIGDADGMRAAFEESHQRHFGFMTVNKPVVLDTLTVQTEGDGGDLPEIAEDVAHSAAPQADTQTQIYKKGAWLDTPIYAIESLHYGHKVEGPAIIVEPTGTIVVEPGWTGSMNTFGHLILDNVAMDMAENARCADFDPVTLEIFNNLYMSIAEQMGIVLRNTSQSVNVKERLDFSCAIFDHNGNLVANAPHVPVHLGSMDSSVKVIIDSGQAINPGDAFVQNNPYNGGSHLPDITVVSPVFDDEGRDILFYVASRAHHEDVGGVAPGSMSPLAKTIHEEGIVLDNLKLVENGVFMMERN